MWFAAELARHESVTFACAAVGEPNGPIRPGLVFPVLAGAYPPFGTRTNPWPRAGAAIALRSFLRAHVGEVEFVHVHNLRTAIATLGIVLSFLRKRGDRFRLLLTDHGARFFPWPRLTARMVDGYAPVSHYSESILQALARRPSRVIPAAVAPAFADGSAVPGWADRDLDLLFTGRIAAWKRPEAVLELAGRLATLQGRTVRVGIAGSVADRGLWDHLAERAARLRPSVEAEFVPHPPDDELRRLYGRAKLFVFASDAVDTFGRTHPAPELSSATVLEAASQGTPALARRIPAAVENVVEGRTGRIVDGFDTPSAVAAAAELIDRREVWQPLSEGARTYIAEERTYPRIVERFRGFLEEFRRGAL